MERPKLKARVPSSRARFYRTLLALLGILSLLGVVGVALAGQGQPLVQLVEPRSAQDDLDPPPPPPDKAEAARLGENHPLPEVGSPVNEQLHPHPDPSDAAVAPEGIVGFAVSDPDIWACFAPDGLAHARIIHEPTPEMVEAVRQYLIDKRAEDPGFMPVVEVPAPPEGCEPAPGERSLEDWMTERSILRVINPDGSIKPSELP